MRSRYTAKAVKLLSVDDHRSREGVPELAWRTGRRELRWVFDHLRDPALPTELD